MKNAKRKSGKAASFDAVEEAIEIMCRWLYGRGMSLYETVVTYGNNYYNFEMAIQSPDGKAGFCDEDGDELDYPVWENSPGVLKEEAVLDVVKWLFKKGGGGDDGDEPFYTISSVAKTNVSPGRWQTVRKIASIPKLELSSLEEFVLKAKVAGL